ncbi:MAG: phage tail tape measure protein [Rhizobiales bacterium]|nr:phage tail tape measure protein [Hyphomicrobiales bacterium]MBA68623.1 phage tail tape measure protein [Hyphomicrobiales bacterium]|tara:strand:+ start:610 stop:2373 length:1764 start_codon:yes stop_codon:yes gene_type:complete
MSNRTIEAVLRLSAKLGSMAGFQRLSKELAGVDQKAKRFNRTQSILAKANRELYASAMRYAGPAVLAYGATKAAKEFATLERRLTRIGINADATKDQMTKAMAQVRGIADDLDTPVDNIVDGLDSLIQSGKSLDEALAFLPSVSRTAHAADADFNDMATTADSVANSFDIAADRMENAFDILAMGGKAGKFELKDMAAELPSLAPAFAALGYKGEAGLKKLTAALQVVRMETGQSGEAATSFMDVITKMNSETVSNNFKKKFGMDIRKEMEKARKAGEDTLDAVIRLSREAVNGDLSKLPLLFTDKQMLIGMRALMNHTGDLKDLFEELGGAAGAVNADIKKLATDGQADIDHLANSWDRLKKSVGKGVMDAGAADAMDYVANSIDYAGAVNAGLEKSGVNGFWARSKWGVMHDQAAKNGMAWRGGYRTDEQRKMIAGYGKYGVSRADTPPIAMLGEGVVPLPVARPGFADQNGIPAPSYPSSAPRFPSRPDVAPVDGGDVSVRPGQHVAALNGILANLERGLESGAGKIAKGGADAGDEMAQRLKTAAEQAASVFGDIVASKIRSASVNVTVRGSGSDIGAGGGGL